MHYSTSGSLLVGLTVISAIATYVHAIGPKFLLLVGQVPL